MDWLKMRLWHLFTGHPASMVQDVPGEPAIQCECGWKLHQADFYM